MPKRTPPPPMTTDTRQIRELRRLLREQAETIETLEARLADAEAEICRLFDGLGWS